MGRVAMSSLLPAPALGLKERGHKITLLANENFRGFSESYGVNFRPLPGDKESMVLMQGLT
jgi:UDP:flavonoid glycosyltransferase YjiC (YdhE family)